MNDSYDVVIIGGAMMGSAAAWFLSARPDFKGRILVVERDPTYAHSSTMHSNSCIRQQFSHPLNVQISQFGADYIQKLQANLGKDPRVPDIHIQNFGYLYLADSAEYAAALRDAADVQRALGVPTRLLDPDELAQEFPFYNLDGIIAASWNTQDEGYWDSGTVFEWWRRKARETGVTYIQDDVTSITRDGARVTGVTLASGARINCGALINAAGPRGARVAQMAGLDLPVEPRKRYTWVISAQDPLPRDLPLTVDPSGIHMRQDGPQTYMIGSKGFTDPAVDFDDFTMDHSLWQDHVWPLLATRIPQFEAVKIVTEWAGHYAYNVIDQNAIIGTHPDVDNFYFMNGFSGHGLQQSPAMGRGIAELICTGRYETLDLSEFGFERLANGHTTAERAVI